jgi:phospholipid/cholesterol/gamma-HCH transport system substrate-binding protein
MSDMKNELFIGISITVATLVVIVGILFLQQATLFGRGFTVYMVVEDTGGVAEGSEVLYRGVHAGTVTNTDARRDSVRLTLDLQDAPPLPEDSRFVIEQQSLLSGMAVKIRPGESEENLESGSTVEGAVKGGFSQLADELGERAEGLEEDIAGVLESIDTLLGEETRGSLMALLEETRDAAQQFEATFAENRAQLSAALESMRTISEENREPLGRSIENLERGSEELVTTLEEVRGLSSRLDSLIRDIQRGEGTAGKMVSEDRLYEDLTATMEEMNSLIKDIKENPRRYMSISIF